jgi:HEPN domain-containing protein
MIDMEQQARYWRDGAQEDWEVAQHLIERGNVCHGLFLVHLAVEKALKSIIVRQTADLAPRIHNLFRLAEIAQLSPSEERLRVLALVNPLNLEGRYPDSFQIEPTKGEGQAIVERVKETFEWLMNQS